MLIRSMVEFGDRFLLGYKDLLCFVFVIVGLIYWLIVILGSIFKKFFGVWRIFDDGFVDSDEKLIFF